MDAALAAVLPRATSSVSASSSGRQEGGAASRGGGGVGGGGIAIGSSFSPSASTSTSSLSPPLLRGLVLVSDSLGADAAFVVAHLLLRCLREGRKVVLVAAAESEGHYGAVLRKLGLGLSGISVGGGSVGGGAFPKKTQQQQQQQYQDQLTVVPLWDDDALWLPESESESKAAATGLKRASELIRKAVEEASEKNDDEDSDNNDNTTALVFDSLSALAAAARSEREWESFVAREVLGSRASCVVARTDCVPGDDGGGGGGGGGENDDDDDGSDGDDDDEKLSTLSSSAGASSAAPWLSALRSAATVELKTRPLPSGAAVDVSGVLVARRGATAELSSSSLAAAAAAPKKRRQQQDEQQQQPPSLAPLSLSSPAPLPPPPPPRSTAVFNYRLVDAAVRLVPRRTM